MILSKKITSYWLIFIIVLIFSTVFAALVWMNIITQDIELFEIYYQPLLIFTSIGIGLLLFIIILNLIQIKKKFNEKAIGAKLAWRMIKIVSLIVMLPSLLFYIFSLDAISRNIDSLNTVEISRTIQDSIELSNASISVALLAYQRRTEVLTDDIYLAQRLQENPIKLLEKLRKRADAYELSLFTNGGQTIAMSSHGNYRFFPTQPVKNVKETTISIRNIENLGSYIEVITPIKISGRLLKSNILLALYPISNKITSLKKNISEAKKTYERQDFIKEPLKNIFFINTSLVFLFSLMAVFLAVFRTSTKLVEPLKNLSEATKEISLGNYDVRVIKEFDDDFGDLINLFNQMTKQIEIARKEAEIAGQEVIAQKVYLETILKYSYGVIALDKDNNIQLINQVCEKIMNTDLKNVISSNYEQLAIKHPTLDPLVNVIKINLKNNKTAWIQEINFKVNNKNRLIYCQCVQLKNEKTNLGLVIMLNDITDLSKAQRQIAWAEVAKRLAHEIRNPLTPIQLSAERLRKKYLTTLPKKDVDVLDKTTTIIMQQVKSLKKMVDAFSLYAKIPKLNKQKLNLNSIVKQTLNLYEQYDFIKFVADNKIPKLLLDEDRINRLVINLIKNAIEACVDKDDAEVIIKTQIKNDNVYLTITDNGGGLADDIKENPFEPYITTKTKGTGLGLAIVKRIVEEHNATINIENNMHKKTMGAKITIILPIV